MHELGMAQDGNLHGKFILTHALPRWDAAVGGCARAAVGLKNNDERIAVGGGDTERTLKYELEETMK